MHVHGALPHAVDQDLFAQPFLPIFQRGHNEPDLDGLFATLALKLGYDARDGRIGIESDELAIVGGVSGGGADQIVDRFQQAGLSLGVGADDDGGSGGDFGLQAGEIAEVGQGEVGQPHKIGILAWERRLEGGVEAVQTRRERDGITPRSAASLK